MTVLSLTGLVQPQGPDWPINLLLKVAGVEMATNVGSHTPSITTTVSVQMVILTIKRLVLNHRRLVLENLKVVAAGWPVISLMSMEKSAVIHLDN